MLQSMWKVVYTVQIQYWESRMLLTNVQHPLHSLVEPIPGYIYIKLYHSAKNSGMDADGFNISMIDDKDSDIPLPLIMFTCTGLNNATLEWQRNKSVHLNDSKSMLKVDRPDRSNHFNYNNDGGNNASYCAATCHQLLTSPGIAATYTIMMNTWNILPESYQPRVYIITSATVKCWMKQPENQMAAVVIRMEAVHVQNAILLY